MPSIDVFEDSENHFDSLRKSRRDDRLISQTSLDLNLDISDSNNHLEKQLSSEYFLGMVVVMVSQFVFAELNCQSGSTVSKRMWIIL